MKSGSNIKDRHSELVLFDKNQTQVVFKYQYYEIEAPLDGKC